MLGLLALLLHCRARRAPGGAYVPLAEQETRIWDQPLLAEAERLLLRAAHRWPR